MTDAVYGIIHQGGELLRKGPPGETLYVSELAFRELQWRFPARKGERRRWPVMMG